MQRRMNGIFAGEGDQSVLLIAMLPFPRLCLQGRAYLLGIYLALF